MNRLFRGEMKSMVMGLVWMAGIVVEWNCNFHPANCLSEYIGRTVDWGNRRDNYVQNIIESGERLF